MNWMKNRTSLFSVDVILGLNLQVVLSADCLMIILVCKLMVLRFGKKKYGIQVGILTPEVT
jgi:hypothetical protein